MELNPQKVAELKAFITMCRQNPSILHSQELTFFREYLESVGARLPEMSEKEKSSRQAASSDTAGNTSHDSDKESVIEEEIGSEVEDDPEIIGPESRPLPPLAPSEEREFTESDFDSLAKLKEGASEAVEGGDLEAALQKYSDALALGNPTALLYTRRAQVLLKLKCPMACIADCTEAAKLNPDNGNAYKLRGQAYRLLGKWEDAHNDLNIGQKIDFDESVWEVQKLVDDNYKKIYEKQRKTERAQEEKEKKRRAAEVARRREEAQRKYEEQKKREAEERQSDPFSGGMPGGFPGGMPGGFPGGMPGGFPGGMPGGFPGGMPGGMGGMPGGMGGMPGGMGGMPGGMGGMPGGMGGMPGGMGGMPGGMGGMPGGMGGMPGGGGGGMGGLLDAFNDPELKKIFENPKMMQAMQEIMTNPAAISKYQSDPEIMAAMAKLGAKFGGGMGGMPGGFPGGPAGAKN